jgi:cell division protein FtsL
VIRVNVLLLVVLVACALSLVTSRHAARRLYVELTREQAQARAYETEYGQLSLEQSTWSMPARVEKIARDTLHMQLPPAARIEVAGLPSAPEAAPAPGVAPRAGAGIGAVAAAGRPEYVR